MMIEGATMMELAKMTGITEEALTLIGRKEDCWAESSVDCEVLE